MTTAYYPPAHPRVGRVLRTVLAVLALLAVIPIIVVGVLGYGAPIWAVAFPLAWGGYVAVSGWRHNHRTAP